MIGIYKIENKINGKVYIGQSTNIEKRWAKHLEDLNKGRHHCSKLQEDYLKYDISNFAFVILEVCEKERLDELEKYYISLNLYNAYNSLKYDCIKNIKHKKDIFLPYGNYISKLEKLTTKRFLLFIFNQATLSNDRYIDVSFTEYMRIIGVDGSNCYYDMLRESIEEIKDVTIANNSIFEEIIINRGNAMFVFDKEIFKIIKNKRQGFKIPIKITDINKIKNTYTICMFELFEDNKISMSIESFKKALGMDISAYEEYAKLKQRVLKPIIADFKNIGIDLKIKEIRKCRKVERIEIYI